MKSTLLEKALRKVVTNSPVLRGFLDNPRPWINYASRLLRECGGESADDGYSYDYTDYLEDSQKEAEREGTDQYHERHCSGCTYCLGFSWADFV